MKCKVLSNILYSGALVEPGEVIDFDDEERCAVLIERGVLAAVKTKTKPVPAEVPVPAKEKASKKKASK